MRTHQVGYDGWEEEGVDYSRHTAAGEVEGPDMILFLLVSDCLSTS